jgi:hypothetical protein
MENHSVVGGSVWKTKIITETLWFETRFRWELFRSDSVQLPFVPVDSTNEPTFVCLIGPTLRSFLT